MHDCRKILEKYNEHVTKQEQIFASTDDTDIDNEPYAVCSLNLKSMCAKINSDLSAWIAVRQLHDCYPHGYRRSSIFEQKTFPTVPKQIETYI